MKKLSFPIALATFCFTGLMAGWILGWRGEDTCQAIIYGLTITYLLFFVGSLFLIPWGITPEDVDEALHTQMGTQVAQGGVWLGLVVGGAIVLPVMECLAWSTMIWATSSTLTSLKKRA